MKKLVCAACALVLAMAVALSSARAGQETEPGGDCASRAAAQGSFRSGPPARPVHRGLGKIHPCIFTSLAEGPSDPVSADTPVAALPRLSAVALGVRFDVTPPPSGAPSAASAGTSLTRAELGRLLFFDPVLSKDRSVSCASCHKPELAFADNVRVSPGVGGALGTRNAPSAMNTAGRLQLFWDGRAASLEEQALKPIENPVEMALPLDEALARINADARYAAAFASLYNGPATARSLGKAIAAFEKTLETANSPYDRYAKGDENAISAEARRGRLVFIGKGLCATCHSGEDFTSDRFKNIGLFDGKALADRGRAKVSNDAADAGAFKVPSLRNVAITAPYMHNGMFATLREVIEYYNDPAKTVPNALHRDPALDKPLGLTDTEITELEAFLRTLTDDRFAPVS